jgi:hypothetical protein
MKVNIKSIIYNPQTKEKMRVTEKEWMNDSDKVIVENKIEEQVNNTTLEEIWDRIFEYSANHNTTENIFDYNTENNLNQPPAAEQPKPQPNPDPSPPFSPLTLPEHTISTNPEK